MIEIMEIINLKLICFHFYFLNIDISVAMHSIKLRFLVCVFKVLLGGSLSQNFYLGLTFDFQVTFCHFLQCNFLHFIK